MYGTHYLPHGADYQRLGEPGHQHLEDLLPGEIVPRCPTSTTGIQATRKAMRGAYIDKNIAPRASFVWTTKSGGTRWFGAWSGEPCTMITATARMPSANGARRWRL